MTERAALWARVSTDDQVAEDQLLPLRAEAARRGLQVTREFSVAESAFLGNHRRELGRLIAEASGYDVVIVWALDRLSREGIEATLSTLRRLRERGVRVISLQEPWAEAAGDAGELLMAVAAWVARMESQRRSERTKAGLARRKAQGLPVGRQPGAKDKRPRKVSGYYERWGR
ncbi:MAG: recombinase family protein [Candidatus Dormibacteria bacterium]